tara:strand:- start:2270 stop:2725 length:456 start_codon:yes stop_codon:yes gene_type:complete
MLFKTHILFGFLIWLITQQYFGINIYLSLVIILLTSILPDIDKSNSKIGSKIKPISFIIEKLFGHRKLFHSLLFWTAISALIWHYAGKPYAIITLIGISSHLIADALTKQGINFLYPLSQFRIAGFIETGSLLEIIFLLTIIGTIIITILF